MSDTTTVRLPPLVVKAVKEVVEKVSQKSLVVKKKSLRRILDSSSESDDDKPKEAGSLTKKRVKFSTPLTEVKGTSTGPCGATRDKLSLYGKFFKVAYLHCRIYSGQ